MNVVPISKPNPWLIDLLADLLDRAEHGELHSFVYCCESAGDKLEVGYSPFLDRMKVIAELERIKFQLFFEMNQEGRPLEIGDGN